MKALAESPSRRRSALAPALIAAACLSGVLAVTSAGASVPKGSVRFVDGTTWLGSAMLNGGVATLTHRFAAGTHSITALYRGDAASAESSSMILTQVVQ